MPSLSYSQRTLVVVGGRAICARPGLKNWKLNCGCREGCLRKLAQSSSHKDHS